MSFSMFLQGPGANEAGRRFVEASIPPELTAEHPLRYISDLLIAAPDGRILERLRYRASPEESYERLCRLLREHPELTPPGYAPPPWSWAGEGREALAALRARFECYLAERPSRPPGGEPALVADIEAWLASEGSGDPDGEARGLMLLGAARYHCGDFSGAQAAWAQLQEAHPVHPLRHRASYHALDPAIWPTPRHPDIDGSAFPDPLSFDVVVPDAEARGQALSALREDPRARWLECGLPMLPIPAGTFTMGGTPAWYPREGPTRRVTLTRPFWAAAWPVTRALWRQFRPESWPGAQAEGLHGELPATRVSLPEAEAFCAWLSEQTPDLRFRIPTEAEWEWACRGGLEGAQYPWGDAPIDESRCNYAQPRPVPVACYAPNGYGLFDTVGNVQEWTADAYLEESYTLTPPEVSDPTGPAEAPLRAVRGGLCGAGVCATMCRNSYRLGVDASYEGSVGLRVVADEI